MAMRKHMIERDPTIGGDGLDLERLASVEITSEDPEYPIERALRGERGGWRAASPGEQIIRLVFDAPAQVRTIGLRFDEPATPRTQEFVLRWSLDLGRSYREIVRQQYTFSPPGTVSETEQYAVDLAGVTVLELRLVPDVGGGPAIASLGRFDVT
jgi:hypothetical protein